MSIDYLQIAQRAYEDGDPLELVTAAALIAIAEELRKINEREVTEPEPPADVDLSQMVEIRDDRPAVDLLRDESARLWQRIFDGRAQ